MAPMPGTPRRSGAGRSRKSTTRPQSSGSNKPDKTIPAEGTSEPPPKKRRYVPGGPGGGGRYVDEDGIEILVGGTGPGGYNYVGPRGRVGRENAAAGVTPVVYPRRDRSMRTRTVLPRSQQPPMRFSSAAQAAAAVVQSDGYKPREERGWEEFHPSLDIDAGMMIYSASEVDGIPKSRPVTPAGPLSASGSLNGIQTPSGDMKNEIAGSQTPTGSMNGDNGKPSSLSGTPPTKRRPGRPPRDPVAFYAARAAAEKGESPQTARIAPLQNQHAKERLTLPQPSYRKVDYLSRFEDKASGLMRYVEKSMANVGYQESDIFIRPDHRLIKAGDSNLEDDIDTITSPKADGDINIVVSGGISGRVEYDMDEQDDKWLETYNAQRRAVDVEPITREIFEITITKIEKEWHALEKRIPKPNPKPPQTHRPRSSSAAAVNGEPQAGEEQDSKCAICDDGDCENTNAIVFCDGCDLAVHQECYGVPFIPEGQWLCRKCQLIGRGIPTCIFCPNTDGAFKQTNSSKWAHLLCAMWIPEVSLGNHTFMEPVMDVEKVPKTRWRLSCYICNQRMGACIQCGNKACYQAFHVTCARRSRLYLKMKNSHGQLAELDGTTVLKAFCDKHCPSDYTKDNDVVRATRQAKIFYRRTMRGHFWASSQATALALAVAHRNAVIEHPPDESQATGARLSLTMNDPKKKGVGQPAKPVWKLPSGAPVIPLVVFDAVESSLQRFNVRKRKEYAAEACRYWTLKREARRGAALLKRLQLQMETFSSMEITRRNFAGMGPAGRPRLARRIEFAERLVADMKRLKDLADLVKIREAEKLKEAELLEDFVNTVYFPIWKLLPPVLEKALTLDVKGVFTEGLLSIQSKLSNRYYVLATTLTQDLCSFFSIGIENGLMIKPDNPQSTGQEHASPLKNVTNDIKERRRKLVKRIIKGIQPQLDIATRAEADLTRKSTDTMVHDLEAILEACLHTRILPLTGSLPDRTAEHGHPSGTVADKVTNGNSLSNDQAQPNGHDGAFDVSADGNDMDADPHDEGAPGEEVEAGLFSSMPMAGEGEPGDLNQPVNDSVRHDKSRYSVSGVKSSNTPPDTNGYSPALDHQQPPPPTPPVSNGGANSITSVEVGIIDPSSLLTEGGIPWYLKSFEPIGTSILETQWTGRDIVRGMTDELSEIDDDELKGMGAEMEGIEGPGEVAVEDKMEAPVSAKKPAKKKKRRGHWF